jgi:hypothetical protein
MTEAKWKASTDIKAMLTFLRKKVSDRKLRLFMAACCRRVVHTFDDEEDADREEHIDVAERYADGQADDEEREDALGDATDGRPDLLWDSCTNLALADFTQATPDEADGIDCAIGAAEEARVDALDGDYDNRDAIDATEQAAQADLLRCVIGPLRFREVVVEATWLRRDRKRIPKLAQAAYDEREMPTGTLETDRLAVLADALEDAGCEDTDLLNHLRSPGPHVRGCWVLDLLLGKE